MSDNSDDILRAYIENVLKIQQERQVGSLSDDELQQIALDAGMSPDDLAHVRRVLLDHVNRGQGFLRCENWEGAIGEFEGALALAPTDTTVVYSLAVACWNHACRTAAAESRRKARLYAERCLRIDPRHDGALRLLSAMQKEERRPSGGSRAFRRIIIVACLLLLGAGVLAYMILQGVADRPRPKNPPIPAPSTPLPPEPPKPISSAVPAVGKENDAMTALLRFGSEGIGPGMFTDARSIAVDGVGSIDAGRSVSLHPVRSVMLMIRRTAPDA